MKLAALLLEDINVKELNPGLVGFYSFLQAINKSTEHHPDGGMVVDIIPDYSLKFNPGPFTFSKNSFKIKINPRTSDISFDESGHDIFHALTKNLAMHFARQRTVPEKQARFNLIRYGQDKDKESKFNLKHAMNQGELNQLKAIAKHNNIPFDINAMRAEYGRIYRIFNTATTEVPDGNQLRARASLIGNIMDRLQNINYHKTHFSTRNKFVPKYDKEGNFYSMEDDKPRHPDAAEKYGGKGLYKNDLPQYDVEEDFGNILVDVFERAVSNCAAINSNSLIKKIKGSGGLNSRFLGHMLEKFTPYLIELIKNYNALLLRYMAVAEKYDAQRINDDLSLEKF